MQEIADSYWPAKGLNSGMAFSSPTLSGYIEGADKLVLIPVLIGISEDTGEEKIYTCDDNFGKEVAIA
jgi:hypothetical protein